MRIKILSSALEDLYEARLFYEQQGVGLVENQDLILVTRVLDLRKDPKKIRRALR